ncbi:5'-3' exonuclease [Brevibacillus daliensis]|uniref:5'-3' exonuclease n=1 Tax=Brevibacillus daliensis TaxID=2892995 RepID=UPI001E337CB7|nr:5'-3' exonuclease H3TH domain-containing protein [Brevibacillus daliensis]
MILNNKVLLIDGMSFLFRAFYGSSWTGSIRQTSSGVYTNAVYGFTKMLLDYADLTQPTHVIAAWDVASRETLLRSQWYDGYKSNRVEPPMELIPQFDLVKEVTSAFSVPNLGVPGYEGDDILGTIANRVSQEGNEVVIVSGDYDSLQLIRDNVHVKILKNGGKHEHYNPEFLLEQKGISPLQVIDVKALQGDTSDCIPGCPGIGEKTAIKLIKEYGSLEGVYENLHLLTPKMRAKLEENKDTVFLCRKLATILCDAPITCDMQEAEWQYDPVQVRDKLLELEFGNAMLTRIG